MSHPEITFVSEEEFLAQPETMDRVELLDGVVIVPPAPTFEHQRLQARLVQALMNWADAHAEPVVIGNSPLDVRFGPNRILQPDVFVLFGSVPRGHKGPLDQIPQLCVEIISSDIPYDRTTKRGVYALAGVQEYWTIFQTGLLERWTGPNLMAREEVRGTLTSPLLPGFSLDLSKLFAI